MNSYELSRTWFNFCFDNPELIKPTHTAIYFMAIEHCNRLGWKQKFGFPSQMVMEAIGVKNWRTYSKALNELVEFGFIKMIEVSKNQYSSNIIAIVKNTKAPTKALDKALSKHLQKHGAKQGQSTVSIDKQVNKEQVTKNKEQVSEICNFAWLLFPETVRPKKEEKKKMQNWADTIDKLIRIDGKDPTEIKEIITWAREDDWWKLKFLSIVKLRKNNPDGIKYYDYFNENRKANGKQRTKIDTKTISEFDPKSYSGFRGSDTSDKSSDQGGK